MRRERVGAGWRCLGDCAGGETAGGCSGERDGEAVMESQRGAGTDDPGAGHRVMGSGAAADAWSAVSGVGEARGGVWGLRGRGACDRRRAGCRPLIRLLRMSTLAGCMCSNIWRTAEPRALGKRRGWMLGRNR